MTLVSLFLFFNIFYIIARIKDDYGIIDIAWGLAFFIIMLSANFSQIIAGDLRYNLLAFLVFIWAIRLSGYILYRNLKSKHEDFRYQEFRKDYGDKVHSKMYLRIYMLQCFLSLLLGLQLYLISFEQFRNSNPFGSATDFIGLFVFIVGFLFESISDYQKNKFKSIPSNQNKTCMSGLWRFSRHPNYFGESLLWFGIGVICLNYLPFYLSFIGPVLLTIFLLKVSGVTMLENSYVKREDFNDYKMKTSAFVPWFPKKG
jgi:steroid 5-alpha reductase family enzyme